jgi:SAM-dependent methyltransferase
MTTTGGDNVFSGSVPLVYERSLVPLIFQPYADELVARIVTLAPARVLEIAAGTGVVTRGLAAWLPKSTRIAATDLNEPMLQVAQALGTGRPITWRQADAMALPFDDGSFDAVVCQFGAMFFPDKARAFAEVHRVLAPGGTFFFNVWDRIEDNDFPLVIAQTMADLFPQDPPTFLERIPHGYHSAPVIRTDIANGGFQGDARIDTVTLRSRAKAPDVPAIAFCQGTPLRNEIEARAMPLVVATDAATRAMAARFGDGAVDGQIQAHVVTVVKA